MWEIMRKGPINLIVRKRKASTCPGVSSPRTEAAAMKKAHV
jgi:hypothetical protein